MMTRFVIGVALVAACRRAAALPTALDASASDLRIPSYALSVISSAVSSYAHRPKSGANAPARAIRRVGRRCGRLTPAGRPAVVGEWAEPNC
ncbi:MAG: hypothetical protein ABSA52_15730, partial [Candidatus Binatia bacterium]